MEPDAPPNGVLESRALTGLRGLAAFMVVSHHLYLKIGSGSPLLGLHWLLQRGYLGVDLFFVLSGFVLSMTYGAWFDGSRTRSIGSYLRFMSRRVARLWPLHAMVLCLIVLLERGVGVAVSVNALVANLAMIQAWGVSGEINPPAWSVSTEFLAYTLFPVLTLLALRGRLRPWLCALGIVLALAVCMRFAPPMGLARRGQLDLYFNYSVLPVLRCLAGFLLGMLAWRVGLIPWVQRLASWPALGPAALAALMALMVTRTNDLMSYGLLPLVVLGMHYGRGPVQRALGADPLHRLGVLSFAIYLVHVALLARMPFGWAPLEVELAAYLLLTLAAAAAAYTLIEEPRPSPAPLQRRKHSSPPPSSSSRTRNALPRRQTPAPDSCPCFSPPED